MPSEAVIGRWKETVRELGNILVQIEGCPDEADPRHQAAMAALCQVLDSAGQLCMHTAVLHPTNMQKLIAATLDDGRSGVSAEDRGRWAAVTHSLQLAPDQRAQVVSLRAIFLRRMTKVRAAGWRWRWRWAAGGGRLGPDAGLDARARPCSRWHAAPGCAAAAAAAPSSLSVHSLAPAPPPLPVHPVQVMEERRGILAKLQMVNIPDRMMALQSVISETLKVQRHAGRHAWRRRSSRQRLRGAGVQPLPPAPASSCWPPPARLPARAGALTAPHLPTRTRTRSTSAPRSSRPTCRRSTWRAWSSSAPCSRWAGAGAEAEAGLGPGCMPGACGPGAAQRAACPPARACMPAGAAARPVPTPLCADPRSRRPAARPPVRGPQAILSPLQKARAIVQSYPFYPDVYQVRPCRPAGLPLLTLLGLAGACCGWWGWPASGLLPLML